MRSHYSRVLIVGDQDRSSFIWTAKCSYVEVRHYLARNEARYNEISISVASSSYIEYDIQYLEHRYDCPCITCTGAPTHSRHRSRIFPSGCLTWNGSKVYDTAIRKAVTRNTLYEVIMHWQPVNYLFYIKV